MELLFVRLPPFLFYEKKSFITFLWNRNYCKNRPFIIFWLQIPFWCMCDVKSYVWSIKKFTLRWRYFFYLLRSSFKLRMTSTFFWYVNKSRWRAHHCICSRNEKRASIHPWDSDNILITSKKNFQIFSVLRSNKELRKINKKKSEND